MSTKTTSDNQQHSAPSTVCAGDYVETTNSRVYRVRDVYEAHGGKTVVKLRNVENKLVKIHPSLRDLRERVQAGTWTYVPEDDAQH